MDNSPKDLNSEDEHAKLDRNRLWQSMYDLLSWAKREKKKNPRFGARFLTLTISSKHRGDKRSFMLQSFESFVRNLRKRTKVEYVGVLGQDDRHIHLVFASNYYRQRALSKRWFEASGYRVVFIKQIVDEPQLYHYFMIDSHSQPIASERFAQVRLESFISR